jgi:hypothetical protein
MVCLIERLDPDDALDTSEEEDGEELNGETA